jgi:phosphate transport system substrate-binding protein
MTKNDKNDKTNKANKTNETNKTNKMDIADVRCAARVLGLTTLAIFLAFSVAVVGGCGKKGNEKTERARAAEAEPRALTIKGSDTMLPMITALAEAYVKVHPDTQISVTGGGSTAGINALLDGDIDLCMSSRVLNTEESRKAAYRRIAPQDVVVALDGVTLVVHPENPVNELTLGQLHHIFNGEIKNLSEVGGPNQAIQVISQNSDSGTSAFFKERVLQNENYKSGIQLAASNAAVVQSVGRELWSIGYVGFAYAQGYPMERPLHVYASGKVNSLAVSFLEFVLSPEGQRIAKEKGCVPLARTD